MVEFSSMKFGSNAAEDEYSDDPKLLLEGYYDLNGTLEAIVSGEKWLVLGPKGAGKSAIAEHIRLMSQRRHDWIAKKLDLLDFPFLDIDQLQVGGQTRGSRLPVVWTYLLCLQIITSLEGDEGFQNAENDELEGAIKSLRMAGLLPATGLSDSLVRLTKGSFKLKALGLEAGIEAGFGSAEVSFYQAAETMRDLLTKVQVDTIHFIIIDGLDTLSLGENDEARWAVLTALITACDRLSRAFRERSAPIRLVLLCRNDIFMRLGYPDANKILGRSASVLTWFPGSRRGIDCELFDLAERKASVHSGEIDNLVGKYLPKEIFYGDGRRQPVHEYLLSYTRYLPRDFLQLLNYIAAHSPRRGLPGTNAVTDGSKEYADKYFTEEVRTGLLPVLGRTQTNLTMDMLHVIPGNKFKLGALRKLISSDRRYRTFDLIECVNALHNIGIIANATRAKGGEYYYNFIFQNMRARLDLNELLILHNAATVGFNRTRQRFY
jgi:hypothetical protein